MKNYLKLFSPVLILFLALFLVTTEAKVISAAIIDEEVSIREKDNNNKQGLHFKARLNTLSEEHGFYLVYGTTTFSELESLVNSDKELILNGKKVFKVPVTGVDSNNDFNVVITGIPKSFYFKDISVYAYVDDVIVSKEVSTNIAETAIKLENLNKTNDTIFNIISDLNIKSVEDFFNSSNLEGLLKVTITHTGNYPYYNLEDESGAFLLEVNNDLSLNKGDELLVKVKKDENSDVKKATLIKDNDLIKISTNNDIDIVSLNDFDLSSSSLRTYESKLIQLNNMYVKHKNEFDNYIEVVLMNTKGQTINLNWNKSISLGNPNFIDLLTKGRIVDLNGVSLTFTENPLLTIDNNNQLSLKDLTSPKIKIIGDNNLNIGEQLDLNLELTFLDGPITWKSNNEEVLTVNNGVISGLKTGSATVTASHKGYKDELEVVVADPDAPLEFTLDDEYEEVITINWNKPYNLLKGIKVYDTLEGDITDQVTIDGEIDNQSYGVQTVTLNIKNGFGKTATMERTVEVIWDYDVTFIGHGGSYYGLMNSEESILYAIEILKYQAIEVDLKQTKDGVFVLSHDDAFGGYTLSNTNWDVLKDVEVTKTRNTGIPSQDGSIKDGGRYTASLLTLERYLEICKEHNVTAIIELKHSPGINQNDQSRMQALMDVIEEKEMLNNVVLFGSQYNCLIWARENGYDDVSAQYMVYSGSLASETVLQRAIDYDFDLSININVADNATKWDEWYPRYQAHGIKISTFTFSQYTDYPTLQTWIDRGVDFVTVDWHVMSELDLPETNHEPLETYEVTFTDYDGTVLNTVSVKEGKPALAPSEFDRLGYKFVGWDKDITAVFNDLTVKALYELEAYNITYDANVGEATFVDYDNKAAFIDDFYNDFYDWLFNYGKDLSCISISGNSLTISLNEVTTTLNSVADLKAMDKYHFEKSFGTLIYKPFNRVNDEAVNMDQSNEYFLNTNPYRLKYQDLDRWFLTALVNNYNTYDRGYNQISKGRVQIMFRFHQWQQGTSIAQFNVLPQKAILEGDVSFNYQLPDNQTYTILDEFDLPLATGEKEFLGWYLNKDLTEPLMKIEKGETGNLILYAKWAE